MTSYPHTSRRSSAEAERSDRRRRSEFDYEREQEIADPEGLGREIDPRFSDPDWRGPRRRSNDYRPFDREFEEWAQPRRMGRFGRVGGDEAPHENFRAYADSSRDDWERHEGRFAGRGPRNYQRSDSRVREDVCDRLTADADVDASDIEVHVLHGEVTLGGAVANRFMKRAAEDCLDPIPGVREIHNQLRVRGGSASPPDTRDSIDGERADHSSTSGPEPMRSK